MTNVSGKFITPKVSHAASESYTAEKDPNAKLVIPPVPTPTAAEKVAGGNGYMDIIRDNFGKLWWLWIVVVFFWLTKGE